MLHTHTPPVIARGNIVILATSYLTLALLLVCVAIISAQYHIPVEMFTRDTAAIAGVHPFTGIISNIGILFWCATAAICLFSSAILWTNNHTQDAPFLLFSALLTVLLLADDLFMFHEEIFPKYLKIPEKTVYAGYLVLTALYFITFRKSLFKHDYRVLFLAGVFFALSIASDIFLPQQGIEFLVEDSFKLYGIVTWSIFLIRACFISQLSEKKPECIKASHPEDN